MAIAPPVLIPPLKELCIKVVAANFEHSPYFGPLRDASVKKVIDNLPLDLPLELVGTLIHDEDYWKRRAYGRWKNLEVSTHGNSWRQLFFERNLQDALEQYDPNTSDENSLRRLMTYSKRFVHAISLRQLPSHLDLQVIFDCMNNSPSSLSIQFHLKNVGMDYDRSLFGMKLADCRALARALERSETLTHLDLSNNSLDDDKIRMLASGLVENISITHLNLAHNKIADRGVRALSKLLDSKSVIAVLELQDNHIHTEGAKSLSRAFKNNECLVVVNMRLNRMGDEGCKSVLDALHASHSVERLNLSANSAGPVAATSAAALIRLNQSLLQLDLSCNALGVDGGRGIRKAVEQNTSLQMLDLRSSQVSADDELAIIENLRSRQEKRDKAKLLGRAL